MYYGNADFDFLVAFAGCIARKAYGWRLLKFAMGVAFSDGIGPQNSRSLVLLAWQCGWNFQVFTRAADSPTLYDRKAHCVDH